MFLRETELTTRDERDRPAPNRPAAQTAVKRDACSGELSRSGDSSRFIRALLRSGTFSPAGAFFRSRSKARESSRCIPPPRVRLI